jgi:hypothetical protein
MQSADLIITVYIKFMRRAIIFKQFLRKHESEILCNKFLVITKLTYRL